MSLAEPIPILLIIGAAIFFLMAVIATALAMLKGTEVQGSSLGGLSQEEFAQRDWTPTVGKSYPLDGYDEINFLVTTLDSDHATVEGELVMNLPVGANLTGFDLVETARSFSDQFFFKIVYKLADESHEARVIDINEATIGDGEWAIDSITKYRFAPLTE